MTFEQLVDFVARLAPKTRVKIWFALQDDLDTMPKTHPDRPMTDGLEAVLWWDFMKTEYA